jgi:conjugative relaxase-like TrwC/TraI family protein
MFTGKPQKNRGAATTYFDEHLSHNDYYTQTETQAGQWIGVGCERLGLQPGEVVTRDAFLKLCDNLDPETGQQLTLTTIKDRRIFFDFQCAPPKSVSILAVTMNDQRIIEAHREASTLALRELEQFAATRIRKGGIEDKDRLTGNLVGAAFMHTSSRALDPQLHTHSVLFNCTWDKTEQRWKALQTSGMFDAIHYGTEVYRNELVKRLQGIGYKIRHTSSAFEIEGVEPELIERFSKRSKERDAAVAKEQLRLGRKLTKDEVANVVHQTRPKKLKGASDEQVRKQQLGEIGFFEKRALRKVVAGADGRPQDFAQRVGTDEAVAHGLAHVFERNSVAPEHRILEAALVKGRGQLDLPQLKEKLAADDHLVRVGSEYSTRHILNRELALIRTVNAGIEAVAPVTRHYEAPAYLGHDQRKAVAHVLTSPDRVTGFRGLAGSGKSTALVELAHTLHRQGFEAVFCAPTASAADTLRRDGLENAMTLEGFYSDLHTRSRLSSRSVVVLDEAGAVGLESMAKLFELAVRRDFRVVLCGDTGQHSSVSRGDALRILEQYSGYRFEELTTIRRQKPAAFRQVVELAAAKQTDKAFAKLLELGAVTEALTDDGQLYQRAADAYLSATKQGKSALLVSPTWVEIEAVTDRVRDTLKAQGVLGQHEEAVAVFDSLSWTEAQKKNASQFVPGQRLRFVRQTKHFDRDDTVEVVATIDQPEAGRNTLRVRRADGSETVLPLGAGSACFDVGEARELKVSPGDWLLLQANHGKEFINGERVQVREIQNGRIGLADGRSLPAGFNAFTHGYAVTSHSSQSKTVDEVLLVASSRSFGAVNREQFYVSISRGRERVHVFTDDADLLARRVTDSHTRKAAVELQALRDGLAKLGFIRMERLEEKTAAAVMEDFHAARPRRPMRQTRLSTVQRLATAVEDVRRCLGLDQTEAVEQKEMVAENVGPAESVKQAESVRQPETVKPARTVREALRHHQAHRQQQRRSGGIHI